MCFQLSILPFFAGNNIEDVIFVGGISLCYNSKITICIKLLWREEGISISYIIQQMYTIYKYY